MGIKTFGPDFEPDPVKRYINKIQSHIDKTAQSWGYDDIISATTYAEETAVPIFQVEGKALREWRSLVWATAHQILGEVNAGNIVPPTLDEIITMLPAVVRPTV